MPFNHPNNIGLEADELMRFSPSGEDKLKMMLSLLLPDLRPTIDQWIRVFVKEEIDLAQVKLLPSMKVNSGNKMSTSASRSLQLQFKNRISRSVLTGKKIGGEDHKPIEVALVDGLTGQIVDTGPEAEAKLEIVVLGVDHNGSEVDSWTLEEFNSKIVRERKGKKILQGNAYLKLKEGIGFVGEISFTHNSVWTKNGEYRLGARVVDAAFVTRVIEAKTESFLVKDRRSTLYEKHYPPSLFDEVWRLDQIRKGRVYHKRLSEASILTVKDLILHSINPKGLKDILPATSTKILEVIVNHARTCKGIFLFPDPGSEHKNGVVFNAKGQLMGFFIESQYLPIDKLSEDQKADAEKAVKSAYEHSKEVVSFDDETFLIGYLQSKFPSRNGPNLGTPQVIDRHAHTLPSTSTQVIKTSLNSIPGTNTLDNLDLHNRLFIVTPASEHWKDAGTSHVDGYNQSDFFFNSIQPNDPNYETPHMIQRHEDDHTQPGTSSQVVKPPLHTCWNTNNFDNSDPSNIANEDFLNDNSIVTGRTPDQPIVTPDTIWSEDDIFQILEYCGLHELHCPKQARCTIGILLLAALMRWIQVSKLRVRRRRRNGIPEGIHGVQKRQRCC